MAYAFVGFGLVLLFIGSESVLRGGVSLSKIMGLSPLLVGLLVISAGTSTPELVVSLEAALHDAPGLALGNVVGSNLVNLLLILGIGALLRPIPAPRNAVLRDGGMLIASSLVLFLLVRSGEITRLGGWLLLAGFAAYCIFTFVTDRQRLVLESGGETEEDAREPTPAMSVLMLIFGLACLYFGGNYVVDGGVAIAERYHVPQAVIGLTLIAAGSSLPELATTIVAAFRGQTSIAIGNLIGSNIFNILIVLGVSAAAHPLVVPPALSGVDIYLMLASAMVLPMMLAMRWRLSRAQGGFLVFAYLAYLGSLAWRQGYLPSGLLGHL